MWTNRYRMLIDNRKKTLWLNLNLPSFSTVRKCSWTLKPGCQYWPKCIIEVTSGIRWAAQLLPFTLSRGLSISESLWEIHTRTQTCITHGRVINKSYYYTTINQKAAPPWRLPEGGFVLWEAWTKKKVFGHWFFSCCRSCGSRANRLHYTH